MPAALRVKAKTPAFSSDGVSVFYGAAVPAQKNVSFSRRELLMGSLLLVGPGHPLPADFPGANALNVSRMVGTYLSAENDVLLRKEAVYALCDLRFSRRMDDVKLTRGAVSAAQQDSLRREAFSRYLSVDTVENALEKTRRAVPLAGESEHQTGLCVDLTLMGTLSYASGDPLRRTESGTYVADNAWRYGLIRRYAHAGLDEIGGCENIHLRYVGRVHAAAMRAGKWTLEEYLSCLREKGSLLISCADFSAYVFAVPGDGGLTVSVPDGAQVSVSADNAGYTIVTAELPAR